MHAVCLQALATAGALLLATGGGFAQSRTNGPAPQAAAKPAAALPPSFESFKAILDRNIFNTRRSVRQAEAPPVQRREVVVESFALLGTLDYPKGWVAFFEGSSTSYRKAVKVDESIGGCKVTAIEPALVMLEANGKPMSLPVGYMLRREDDGEWKLREAERPVDSGFSFSSSPGASSAFPFGSSSSSSRDPRFSFPSSRDSRYSSSSRDSRSGSSSSSFRSSPFGGSETPADAAQRRIREQDRNGDGKVSLAEADSRLRDRFRDMDRNGDGQVDAEEYTAYYASRMGGSPSSSTGGTFNPGTLSSPGGAASSGSGTSAASPVSPSPSSGSSTGSTSSGGASESDLLKRLMEQRARENR